MVTTFAAAAGTVSPSIVHACGVFVDGQCVPPNGPAMFVETPAGPTVIGPNVLTYNLVGTSNSVRSRLATGTTTLNTGQYPSTTGVGTATTDSTTLNALGTTVTDDPPSSNPPANGGCSNNASCSNLELYGGAPYNDYWSYSDQFHMSGTAIISDLIPTSDPNDPNCTNDPNETCWGYDFMDTLSSLTPQGDSLCEIINSTTADTGARFITYWPQGHTNLNSNSGDTITLSANLGPFTATYQHTFTVSGGYQEGDTYGPSNNRGPHMTGFWMSDGPGDQSDCQTSNNAFESGAAFATPDPNDDGSYYAPTWNETAIYQHNS